MSVKLSTGINWDVMGISASLFCAAHCLLLPVLITTLPLLGIEFLENPIVEIMTLILSAFAGVLALYTGYRKQHRQAWPMVVFVFGMGAMLAGNFEIIHGSAREFILKSLGVVLILTAHIANWRYRKSCGRHRCADSPALEKNRKHFSKIQQDHED